MLLGGFIVLQLQGSISKFRTKYYKNTHSLFKRNYSTVLNIINAMLGFKKLSFIVQQHFLINGNISNKSSFF